MNGCSYLSEFSEKKFKQLPPHTQHRQAAKLLRALFEHLHHEDALQSKLHQMYEKMAAWKKWPSMESVNHETLSDSYHWHLEKASWHQKEHNLLPAVRKGDRSEAAKALPISIYLDKLRSAHNIGSIIRTAEAFSLGSLYFSPGMAFIDNKQVQDASMGTFQWIPCFQNIPLTQLQRPIIALETSEQAQNFHHYKLPDQFTLVVGNEEYGCSHQTLQMADELLEIPLKGRKNSLNVANAFAIAAYEIQKQKRY